MPLTLEQYAAYLDTRDLHWPAPPEPVPVHAISHLVPLPEVRVVLWSVYGTLLAISGGELLFEHPEPFVMSVALDKTIQEFKMWGAMSRKPGQPAEYMQQIYSQILTEQKAVPGGIERFPEVVSERIWETILKRLMQKDYKFDAGFFGSLNEFSRKVAYFFHSSLQGVTCYPRAAKAMRLVNTRGLEQGLLADGQSFTILQLERALRQQDPEANLPQLLAEDLTFLSCDSQGRKPSERFFRRALDVLRARGIAPREVLHVGARLQQDLVPARRLGMRTALYAGDRNSLQVTSEQLKESANRPDILLTRLSQLKSVVGIEK
jgi:FMN phosphatase YigB (HAD superfamily)